MWYFTMASDGLYEVHMTSHRLHWRARREVGDLQHHFFIRHQHNLVTIGDICFYPKSEMGVMQPNPMISDYRCTNFYKMGHESRVQRLNTVKTVNA